MKCVLSGPNSRIFAKAVQSLAKFGTDLFIEADQNGFQLRTMNLNKSAVGTYTFYCEFFDGYDITKGSSGEENCCRLSMKACLGVFKNMKLVETCHIQIEPTRSKFLVQMNCRFEAVKHYILSIIDDENISSDIRMDDAPNTIRGSCKIFSDIASNFQTAEEEITLEAGKETLMVKNYVEGSLVNNKFMRSQLRLTPEEFDEYNISEETSVTFCLREFRALLLFAEAVYECMNIIFSDAGSPIVFQIKKADIFEATLIMSTLSPDDVTMCEDPLHREITESFLSRTTEKPAAKRKPTKQANPKSKRLNSSNDTQSQTPKMTVNTEDTEDYQSDAPSVDLLRNYASAGTSDEQPRIPDITNLPPEPESEVFVTFVETEETTGEDEQIPQSPGNRASTGRLRLIFSRCFESTYVPQEPSPNSQVYVPDSDDEN